MTSRSLGHSLLVLISTHVLSGALLGRTLRRPLPALLLGVGSHLRLDHLPHWGNGGGRPPQLGRAPRGGATRRVMLRE